MPLDSVLSVVSVTSATGVRLSGFGIDGGEQALRVWNGASASVDYVAIINSTLVGVIIGGWDTIVSASNLAVEDTLPDAAGIGGRGIEVQSGATLVAEDCRVERSTSIGILVGSEGTQVELTDVVVLKTRRGTEMSVGIGLHCESGGQVAAADLVVQQTEGLGLFAAAGGNLSCTGCDLLDNSFAGALVWEGGALALTSTDIIGTEPDANLGGGVGIFASGGDAESSVLSVETTTIEDHSLAAVWLDGNGAYSIRNSTLVGGYGVELEYPDGSTTLLHGDAIVAVDGVAGWDGTTGLLLEGDEICGAARVGIMLDGSPAALSGNIYSDNAPDLVWQECEGVTEPTGLGEVPVYDDRCSSDPLHMATLPLEFSLYLEEAEIEE